jgi:hypothetical protein
MPLRRWILIAGSLVLLAGLAFTGCSASPAAPDPTATPTPSLTPALTAYHTPTPSSTPSGAPPSLTPIPSATPTLFKYKVGKDDDMFGLAWRFGVSVAAIKTANPSVHPNYMGDGTVLIIPITPTPPTPTGTAAGQPSPSAALTLTAPHCYPDALGGLWCLALLRNPGPGSLESPSAVFRLPPDAQGQTVEQTVYAPLNVLPGGASLPIVAYFSPPVAGRPAAEAQPADSLPLAAGDPRYPAVTTQAVQIQMDGVSATAKGQVTLGEGVSSVKQIWLLAVAYDREGNFIGLRKWESPESVSAGGPLSFTLNVYSLGPPIDHVEVLVEGHR